MSGIGRTVASPDRIESVGNSVRARGESVSSGHTAQPLPEGSLGSLVAPHLDRMNSHIGQLGSRMSTMGGRFSRHGELLGQTATNIRQNESDIAGNMRTIQNGAPAIPPRTSSLPGGGSSRPPLSGPPTIPPRTSSLGATGGPTTTHGGGTGAESTSTSSAPPPPPPPPVRPGGASGQGTSSQGTSSAPPPPPPPPPPGHGEPSTGTGSTNTGPVTVDPNRLYRPQDLTNAPDRPVNGQTVAQYGDPQHLNLQNPPRIVRIPQGQNLTINDPLSSVPATHQHGFGPQDQNRPLGEVMWGMQPHQLDGGRVQDYLDMAGGGGYSHNTGVTALDSRTDDRTLYHELGHQQQNQNGLNGATTNNTVLEYHNIVHNENAMPGTTQPRVDYRLAPGPLQPRPNQTWDSMRQDVNTNPGFPQQHRVGTNSALDQINQQITGTPDEALIRQNLVTEYYRNRPS